MPSQRQRRHSRPFDIFSSDSCSCLGVLLLNERFHHPSSHLSHKPGLPLWPSRLHTIIIHLLVVLLPFFLFEWVPAILYRLTSNSSSQEFLLFEFPVAAGTTGIYGCAWHSCRYSKSLCSLTQRSYTDVHGLNGSEHTQICWITGKIWYAVWFAIFWGQHVGWSLYHILRQMSNSTKKIKKQLSAFIHFTYSPFRSNKVYSPYGLFPCTAPFPFSYSCKSGDFAEIKDQSVGYSLPKGAPDPGLSINRSFTWFLFPLLPHQSSLFLFQFILFPFFNFCLMLH